MYRSVVASCVGRIPLQAVWKSTSIVSVWVDFNKYTEGLFADPYTPSVAHKETSDGSREVLLPPSRFLHWDRSHASSLSVLCADLVQGKTTVTLYDSSNPRATRGACTCDCFIALIVAKYSHRCCRLHCG